MKKTKQVRAEAEVVQDVQAALLEAAQALEQVTARLKPLREEMRSLPSVEAVEREMESPTFNNRGARPPVYRLYSDVVDLVDLGGGRGLRALAAEIRRNANRPAPSKPALRPKTAAKLKARADELTQAFGLDNMRKALDRAERNSRRRKAVR
jgi:hypothetical protein